jgi:hypothetical protein
MRNNLVVIVVGAVIVSYLLISPFVADWAVGQQRAAPAAGRYQMVVGKVPWGVKDGRDAIYVLDTQTGQVWQKVPTQTQPEWRDYGSPTRKDKKE